MSLALKIKERNRQKSGFFRFKQLNSEYLITNDAGEYCFLQPEDFDLFLSGNIEQTHPKKYGQLQCRGFIRDQCDFDLLSRRYAKKNIFLGQGTSLHIVVITLRCDHKCIYCQASSKHLMDKTVDMDIPTAQIAVDRIFESHNQNITIEFQGGEPLANWDTLKFIINYAYKKNAHAKKDLRLTVVSNLSFLSQEILSFLKNNDVHICTSLDGPEDIHNKNRIISNGKNSYKNTIKMLKKIKGEFNKKNLKNKPNALLTVTRHSLAFPEKIVDEYVNLDLEGIHVRPVNPFGISAGVWQRINYSEQEFVDFYYQALDYIIKLNLKGKKFFEKTAKIFLSKILTDEDPNYLDLRSPCGAGIGQLAYNFNGDIYTCDEGRMLSREGDESFRIGNVRDNSYQDIMDNNIVKTMCIASCLDNLPGCSECVYKPYCGVCPIYNYVREGSIFSQQLNNDRCKINKAILDYLFERLREKKCRKIFENWIKN